MSEGSSPLDLPSRQHPRWVYVLPSVHLIACMSLPLGYVMPSPVDGYCGIVWVFVMLLDIPVSFPAYALAWRYEFIAATWVFAVGTLWWFFLSRTMERIILRFRHRHIKGKDF